MLTSRSGSCFFLCSTMARTMSVMSSGNSSTADASSSSGGRTIGPSSAILASQGETEHAWQVATNHGCGRELWLTQAGAALNPLEA